MVRPTSCSVRSSANQPINSPILAPAHSTTTVPLVPHSPIRVVQRQSCHLDRTQSQEGEQQEDRPISSAPRLRVITAHCCIHAGNGQRNGKTGVSPTSNRGHGRGHIPADQLPPHQVAQQRPRLQLASVLTQITTWQRWCFVGGPEYQDQGVQKCAHGRSEEASAPFKRIARSR